MWGYIIGISGLFFTILGVLATIFGWRLRRKVKRETETQISKSQLQESGVEKEQETQIPPQPTMTDEAGKLGVPRLMEILKDLGSYSTRLSFIKTNIDLMPASLSLDELHRILALFGSYDYKLTVIQIFLPRLPDSLSQIFLPRLPVILIHIRGITGLLW